MSTIFIHAAKNEPWGVSVHEAISCDCTVITSDMVGSSKDLISEGVNGFTYSFGDYTYLANQIQESVILNRSKKNEINQLVLETWGYQSMWKEIKNAAFVRL